MLYECFFFFSLRSSILDKLQTCQCFCPLHYCIWEHGSSFASSKLFFLLDSSSRIACFITLRKESTSSWENSGFDDDHSEFLLTKSRNFSKDFIMYKPQSMLFGCGGTVGYLISFTSSVFFPLCGNFTDHTSWSYLVIFTSTDLCSLFSESSIIREICGRVLTITRIQW